MIEVRLVSPSGCFLHKIEIENNTRVQDVLSKLKIPAEQPMLIMVNGLRVAKEQMLEEGDVVELIPPFGGG